jgi:hypothetical protein
MYKVIIYNNTIGSVSILMPTIESGLTVEEVARKDVPAGVPYKIIDVADIPTDRTFRNAWECVIDEPDGYGIGQEAWFAEKEDIA